MQCIFFEKGIDYAVYNGVWAKAPSEAGVFSKIFVLKLESL